jgi:2-polyprenyl-3-methyl-5-hydroxy-6-metoxy-1,4-benzoquinol methylase
VENNNERKMLERKMYEKIYRNPAEKNIDDLKKRYLAESEQTFLNLIADAVQNKTVLEIGCGPAKHSIYAAQRGAATVFGIDISEAGIELAIKNAIAAGVSDIAIFEVMAIENLANSGKKFDVIINHEVFSSICVSEVLPILSELLNENGIIICKETFGHNLFYNLNRRFNHLFKKRTAWAASHIIRARDLDEAKRYFSHVRIQYFHVFAPFVFAFRHIFPEKILSIIGDLLAAFDRQILSVKCLRWSAFKVIFVLSK